MNTVLRQSGTAPTNRIIHPKFGCPNSFGTKLSSVDENLSPNVPNFAMRNGKLVEVLFGRSDCSLRNVTILFTYFEANKRHYRQPNKSESHVNNEFSKNDYYSNKPKLCTTVIENQPKQLHVTNKKQIYVVLKDLGFVWNYDRRYAAYPFHLQYVHDYHKHNTTGYNSNSYISPKPMYHQQNIKLQQYIKSNQLNSSQLTNNGPQDNLILSKYWNMRYTLFSKFDQGILLDAESFYSVCPEVLSYHIAKRCKNRVVLDPFCGAGGNIIQLAYTCKQVIAVDIDPNKIRMARHNAEIYGVAHKIKFIVGDIFSIYQTLKADVVYMSPPWGGPEYSVEKCYSIKSMCADKFEGGFGIFDIVKTIAPNIAFHVPKTTNILELLWLANDIGKVEIQQNILNGKLNSITTFFGDFFD